MLNFSEFLKTTLFLGGGNVHTYESESRGGRGVEGRRKRETNVVSYLKFKLVCTWRIRDRWKRNRNRNIIITAGNRASKLVTRQLVLVI